VISLKGEVRKTISNQVSVGPGGEQQKIELGSTSAPPPSGGRLKQRIVAKKTNEFQQYGQDVAGLAKQYAPPDPQLLQLAYQQGNIFLQLGGARGTVTLVIKKLHQAGRFNDLGIRPRVEADSIAPGSHHLTDPKDAVPSRCNSPDFRLESIMYRTSRSTESANR